MTEKEMSGFSLRITQSSKTALTAITLEIAQVYIRDAVAAFDGSASDNADDEKYANDYIKAVRSASRCVDNLISSLDLAQEISKDLLVLYQYMKNRLLELRRRPDKDILLSLGRCMASLQKSFEEVAKLDKSGPMMANTQKVYAGLTYGQNSLNETLDITGNRGFLA